MEYEHIVHPFPPLFDENSEIRIFFRSNAEGIAAINSYIR